jgi:hypothetical protein
VLISETEHLLRSMLDRAAPADVPTTVEVFRRFAAVPVDDAAPPDEDGDGVLAEFGTFTFGGDREFQVGLTRQFIEAADEDAMWQLHCTFYWTPDAETEALGSDDLWSFDMPLDDFFTEALVLPGWAWALAGVRAPRRLTIGFGEV